MSIKKLSSLILDIQEYQKKDLVYTIKIMLSINLS